MKKGEIMKVEKVYTKYCITEKEFGLYAKVSGKSITLAKAPFLANNDPESSFTFIKSKPELVAKFAKAMQEAVKLSKIEG